MCGIGVQFHSFARVSLVVPAPFVEETDLSLLGVLGSVLPHLLSVFLLAHAGASLIRHMYLSL